MKRFHLIIINILLFHGVHSQIIENRINLSLGYITGSFLGKELSEDKNFQYPSLFSNLKKINGVSFKIAYNLNKQFNVGINIESCSGLKWDFEGRTEYSGAEINLKAFSPSIQFQSKFSKQKLLNLYYFFEISPRVGLSTTRLSNPLNDIQNSDGIILNSIESTDMFYGYRSNIGLKYLFSINLGTYSSFSYEYNWINSKLFNDKSFSRVILDFGVFIMLVKNKRYFY